MVSSLFVRAIALTILLLSPGTMSAHEYTLGTLTIGHPWARATPAGAKVAGAFLSVENKSDMPDRLIQVSIEGAKTTEIHQMLMEDGMMKMRPMANGLDVPAGTKTELKPGSYHLMLMGLAAPLVEGQKIKGVLTFEKAGTIEVEFKVEAIGGNAGQAAHQHSDVPQN